MQYILFGLLVLLFVISYYFGGKDFFAPMTVQVIGFSFACLACSYFMYSNRLPYKLHLNTVFLIISCLLMSVFIGIWIHQMFQRIKIPEPPLRAQRVTPISGMVNIFAVTVLLITIFWMLYEIRRIGGASGTFSEIMVMFRNRNSTSTDIDARFPFVLRQLQHLVIIFFVIYAFNFFRFFDCLSVLEKITNLCIMGLCLLAMLLSGARSSSMNYIIACAIIFHLLRIQKQGGYKTYRIGFILRIVAAFCIVLWFFSVVRGFVGRTNQMGALDYIAYYTGAEIVNLDLYLQDPIFTSGVFGKYTFYTLITNLRTLGANIDPYTIHLEYRSISGVGMGNVYTLFRTYYADFGVTGVYVLHGLASVFLSTFYEYVKKRKGNAGILVFSLMYYSVVLSFFSERIFSNLLSVSFVENVLLVLIFYKLFLQKRIRFTLGGKRNGLTRQDI